MPRNLGSLVRLFAAQVDESVQLVRAAETIRHAVPHGSHARRGFSFRQIEAVYELAYLRVIAAWEVFLEESFLRLMCGYLSGGTTHAIQGIPVRTIEDARIRLLGGQRYKLWHDPVIVSARVPKFFVIVPGVSIPHDGVIASAVTLIKDYGEIRHHIAHLTNDTCSNYHAATMRLTGARYGRRAGRFLRTEYIDPVTGLRSRWLDRISDDLKSLATQFL